MILNYCNINNNNISFICDANPSKRGKVYLSHIEIISKTRMRKIKPKYLIVFIWSFRREVIKQEKIYYGWGKINFPLPVFHVV